MGAFLAIAFVLCMTMIGFGVVFNTTSVGEPTCKEGYIATLRSSGPRTWICVQGYYPGKQN